MSATTESSATVTENTSSKPPDPPPYTVFSKKQKRLYSWVLGYLTLASPLTATVYFPLIPLLQKHYNTSLQAINVTLTLYLVFQGISPVLLAPFSDVFGRRPIFLSTFVLYIVASLGLALNEASYTVLLVLRALQSIGASAVLAVAYGLVADVSVPSERGRMLSAVMAASNLGPCVGPLIGGIVAWSTTSFQWIFWALMIFGFVALCLVGFTVPETARAVVGNGELIPQKWTSKTWWGLLSAVVNLRKKSVAPEENVATTREKVTPRDAQAENAQPLEGPAHQPSSWRQALRRSNPIKCLQIICHWDTSLVLWMSVSFYTVWYTVQASISSIFASYGFNELCIAASFLPGGFGVIIGGWVTGRIMDRNYKRTAEEAGLPIDRHAGDNLDHFPVEQARAKGSAWLLALFAAILLSFGWTVEKHVHPAAPLVFQFLLALICTYFFQTFNSLLVDIFPESPSTAAAAGNISRCALSGAAVALLQPIVDAVGRGWFFSILCGFVSLGNVIALTLIRTQGSKWRKLRISKDKASR